MIRKTTVALFFLSCSAFLILSYRASAYQSASFNGTSYSIPEVGDENWYGSGKVDALLLDLANNGFAKTGGNFTLTNEVNFGGTAGLVALYWGTRSSNDATSGVFRLSNTEYIGWRNAGNSANLLLGVDSSDNLTFNGTSLMSSSGLVPVSSGGTGLSSYAVGDLVYATPNSQTLTKLPIGTTSYVLKSNGTVPGWGQIVNASVDSSAAIDRSKLGTGTADHVVINSGSGAFSSEAQLAVSRGGTNIGSYTPGDLLYASGSTTLSKIPIGTAGQSFKVSGGGIPTWSSSAVTASIATKTSDYTLTSNDDVILVSPTSGTIILALPSASANAGKIYQVNRVAIGSQLTRISASSGDTIDGPLKTLTMASENDTVSLISDGVSSWKSLSKNISIAMKRTNSAGTAISSGDNIIPFATAGIDTHSGFSTNTYTVPYPGRYLVTATILSASTSFTAGANSYLYLQKNGVNDTLLDVLWVQATATHQLSISGSTIINCSAGDTLKLNLNSSTGYNLSSSAGVNSFSVSRIGN